MTQTLNGPPPCGGADLEKGTTVSTKNNLNNRKRRCCSAARIQELVRWFSEGNRPVYLNVVKESGSDPLSRPEEMRYVMFEYARYRFEYLRGEEEVRTAFVRADCQENLTAEAAVRKGALTEDAPSGALTEDEVAEKQRHFGDNVIDMDVPSFWGCVGREVGDTEKCLRIHTEFSSSGFLSLPN